MKKAFAIILVMLICLSVCACGGESSKYVGTYSGYYGKMHYDIVLPSGFEATTEGTRTLVLNADGTGRETYVGKYNFSSEDEEFTIYDYDITWEVIDGYIYVTGVGSYLIGDYEKVESNDRYRLEGKTLVDADNPNSISGKLTKQN